MSYSLVIDVIFGTFDVVKLENYTQIDPSFVNIKDKEVFRRHGN